MSSIQATSTPSGGGGFSLPSSIQGMIPQNMGSAVNTLTSVGQIGNAAYAGIQGAKIIGPNAGTIVQDVTHFSFNGLWTAFKGIFSGTVQVAEKSAIVQGAISLVSNAYKALTHQESYQDAGANVVGDTASGAVGGATGALAGGFGTALLGLFGLSGGIVTIGAALIGLGGFYLGEKLFKSSSIYNRLYNGTKALLSGSVSGFSNTAPAPAGT